jgi:hypothetical protein
MAIDEGTRALIPRSRRAMLAGALGGLAGLVAGRLGRPTEVSAAPGSPLIIGSEANNAGTKDTQLLANSNVVTFKLYQQGPGTALMGYTTPTTGQTRGVYGRVDSPNGDGVQGRNAGPAGTGAAVRAYGVNNEGVRATTENPERAAIYGFNEGATGVGVWGEGYGESDTVVGVGVIGLGTVGSYGSGMVGSYGYSPDGLGVLGWSETGTAVYAEGDAVVTGNLSKAGGSFKIDHPLDPANKFLLHSFVESPDMKNVYDGVVALDSSGEATVELPAWFEALNRDFRYQLTAIGSAAPDLHVKAAVKGNQFRIAGGSAGQEISWQITGIRQDAWANENRIPVEVPKSGAEKGKLIHPKAHGKPASAGISRAPRLSKLTGSGRR